MIVPEIVSNNSADVKSKIEKPLISIIISGRNDSNISNFTWRFSTVLNKYAENIVFLDLQQQTEILVPDAGGAPLYTSLELTEKARELVRFLIIPPELEARSAGTSFSENHAINAIVRRAKGKFIMLSDSNMFMPFDTMAKLRHYLELGYFQSFNVQNSFFLASKYLIPHDVTSGSPYRENLETHIAQNWPSYVHENITPETFSESATFLLMTSDMWLESTGFDEQLTHSTRKYIDLARRLLLKYRWDDLENHGMTFLQFAHESHQLHQQDVNEDEITFRSPTVLKANESNWGLEEYGLSFVDGYGLPIDISMRSDFQNIADHKMSLQSVHEIVTTDRRYFNIEQRFDFNQHSFFGNADAVKALLYALQPVTVCEIGSWMGASARYFANSSSIDQVVCVDHWDRYRLQNYKPGEHPEHMINNMYEQFLANAIHSETADKIFPLRLSSDNAAAYCHEINKKFDLIYIDGDHTTVGARADIIEWFPLLNEGGYICGDDWSWQSEPDNVAGAVISSAKLFGCQVFYHGNFWLLVTGEFSIQPLTSQVFNKIKPICKNKSENTFNKDAHPLVSIFCTCKNAEATIRRHLKAVLAAMKEYDNIEYIVQDGASTDSTLSIFDEYKAEFGDKLRLLSVLDSCCEEGFWLALSRCKGEIICASLSDEEILPDAIPFVVEQFQKNIDLDVIHGDIFNTDLEGTIQYRNSSTDFDLITYLSHKLPMHLAGSFFRKSAFKKACLLPFPGKYGLLKDDFFMWAYLALNCHIKYFPKVFAKYAVHQSAISVNPTRMPSIASSRLEFLHTYFELEIVPEEIKLNKYLILKNVFDYWINAFEEVHFFDEAQRYRDRLGHFKGSVAIRHGKDNGRDCMADKKKQKVLLLSLPGLNTGDEPIFPLGIGYLLASLRQDKRPVQALHYQRPDHVYSQLPEVMQRFSPDIVGLTCTTFNRGLVREICTWLRTTHPHVRIVLGGVHVSFMYEQALREYGADYVVIGEGEITLRELCTALDQNLPLQEINGIAFLHDNQLVTTHPRETVQNLDELPMPDYSFAGELMRRSGMGFVISSRGCPVQCSFCSTSSYWGQKVRMNSPRRVVDEMESLVASYGVKKIFFHDDTFNLGITRVREICAEITGRGLKVEWGASCRVSPVSEEMIDLMVAAGCRHICWGIESGSKAMLARIGKRITQEQISKAFECCRKHLGVISVGAFTMVGNPGESPKTIAESIQFIGSLQMTDPPSTAVLYILPGTKLYAELLGTCPELASYWTAYDAVPYYTLEYPMETLSEWSRQISLSASLVPFDRNKHFWNKVLFGAIPEPTPPSLSFLASELDQVIPPEIKDDEFYHVIQKLAEEEAVRTVLEIGSSAGGGSTEAFVKGLGRNGNHPRLFCMEVSKPRFDALRERYAEQTFVRCYHVSSIPIAQFPSEETVTEFYRTTRTGLNNYPLERVIGWLYQDIDYILAAGVPQDGIERIKRENQITTFDMVLIDGSEFTGEAELEQVYGAKLILLDDINGFKNYRNRQRLFADPTFSLVCENWGVRNGYAVFRKNPVSDLPIHFFTIVLNGEPFIKQHLKQFLKLPFRWHWHIVEGVAELKHDTAWSLQLGGRISGELHSNGLSNDGTTEYLDQLAQDHPDKISVYRKPNGQFWDGKLEMVSAPLANITEECLLWQVDADELWSAQNLTQMHEMFVNSPDKTAAYFHCDYFVGPNKYVCSLNTWATSPTDWIRVWRFAPGMVWAAHEPPILIDAIGQNVGMINTFSRDETKSRGITFQHFAYSIEAQVRFKEVYYGYSNAVLHWRRLQETIGPVDPAHYLPWASPGAIVDDWTAEKGKLMFDCSSSSITEPKQYVSMSVDASSQFETELRRLFQRIRPTSIIETGTYLGQGTSSIIWRALHDFGIRADFTTIEVNPEHHRQALEYFQTHGMEIRAVLGLSVPRALLPDKKEIAEQFVQHKEYDGIYYDHDESVRADLYYSETDFNVPDNLLYNAMQQFGFRPAFVLLDSAGHMGFLEFQYFMKLIQEDCYLMLDDIFHCKHFKTLQAIKQDPRFEILVESREKFGFCIVKYHHVRSLVLMRTDAIGDNVLASAMLPYLRKKFESASLALVCQDRVAPLYDACPYIDELVSYSLVGLLNDEKYRQGVTQRLNALKPDMLINAVYSRDQQNCYLSNTCNAPLKITIEGDTCNIAEDLKIECDKCFTTIVPNAPQCRQELERHAYFLGKLGLQVPKLQPLMWVAKRDYEIVETLFRELKLDSEKTLIVFPGSLIEKKKYKHFYKMLRGLHGYTLLMLGGSDAEQPCEELCTAYPGLAFNLAGKTSILQMAAVMSKARLYVGADTSGAHVACAVGLPNVVILGGGHFGRFLPYSGLTTAVCFPLACYNCNWQCRHSRCHCVDDIRPDVVISAVKYALAMQHKQTPTIYRQLQSGCQDSPPLLTPAQLTELVDITSLEIVDG